MNYSERIKMVTSNQEETLEGKLVQKSSGISSMPTFAEKYANGTYGWGSFSRPYTVGTREEMEAALEGSMIKSLLKHLES